MTERAVVVLSGGMDSATLLWSVLARGFEASALSVDYGQRHARELRCAKALCEMRGIPWRLLDLGRVFSGSALVGDGTIPHGHYAEESMKLTVVPNRNMVLLALAISEAVSRQASVVFYGAHAGDHAIYPDCRPPFVEAMAAAALVANWQPVRLEAPFLRMSKGDIAFEGLKLGVPYESTWTCYEGGEAPCGACGACVERAEAFEDASRRMQGMHGSVA